jgi:hypothetical protein
MYRLNMPKFLSVACPNCHTIHDRCPVKYDEQGGYVDLDTHPCADDHCTAALCGCCPQFDCESCGLIACTRC